MKGEGGSHVKDHWVGGGWGKGGADGIGWVRVIGFPPFVLYWNEVMSVMKSLVYYD